MKETVHFTKMHGAGNDYIYVDTQLYDIPNPEKAAIAWSAYHTGIGSDGLVLIGKPQDGRRADYSMRIFNADGSEAMMCGNASRSRFFAASSKIVKGRKRLLQQALTVPSSTKF